LQHGFVKWRRSPAACSTVSSSGEGLLQLAARFRRVAKGFISYRNSQHIPIGVMLWGLQITSSIRPDCISWLAGKI